MIGRRFAHAVRDVVRVKAEQKGLVMVPPFPLLHTMQAARLAGRENKVTRL